jgi:hypothetical protein
MKRLMLAVLAIGGLSLGIGQTRTEAAPDPATSSSAIDSTSEDRSTSNVVTPQFIECEDNQVCTTVLNCGQLGGISGGPFCSSGGRQCCTLGV